MSVALKATLNTEYPTFVTCENEPLKKLEFLISKLLMFYAMEEKWDLNK